MNTSRISSSPISCSPIRGSWSASTDEDFTSKSPALSSVLYMFHYGVCATSCQTWTNILFSRLSDHYAFQKPNDRRALDLMNAAAVEVMKELPDLCIAYGVSDEYRYVRSGIYFWHYSN